MDSLPGDNEPGLMAMHGDMNVHFSSASNEWSTPDELFDKLNAEFRFTVDAAASIENAKCPKFWTYKENGLAQDWRNERVWCNPPYGREIGKWIEKAAMSQAEVAVLLIPARTDTRAWHQHILGKAEIRFIQGRVKFGGASRSTVPISDHHLGSRMLRSHQRSLFTVDS